MELRKSNHTLMPFGKKTTHRSKRNSLQVILPSHYFFFQSFKEKQRHEMDFFQMPRGKNIDTDFLFSFLKLPTILIKA